MINLYCKGHQHNRDNQDELCPTCLKLRQYAFIRLEKCMYGNEKGTCGSCPTHCYQKEMKTQIQQVMRYSGPRMLWKHPLYALDHMYKALFKKHKRKPRKQRNSK